MVAVEALEASRMGLQQRFDASKEQGERNRLGQFATPAPLALDVMRHARSLFPTGAEVRFLDPAFGTGSFYSALLRTFPEEALREATGFEIDHAIAAQAQRLWQGTLLRLQRGDFTRAQPPPEGRKATLLICNPPYVRHHHLAAQEKVRLQMSAKTATEVRPSGLSGLSGLYCYFLLLSDAWMAPGGIAGWLIPSEFMDVNYGRAVKDYLLNRVTLLRIHRFDPADVQFEDALVSSTVVWFKKSSPPEDHRVEFSYGGTLARPKVRGNIPAARLRSVSKWTRFPMGAATPERASASRLGELFEIKRGLATGANDFFILAEEEALRHGLPEQFLTPVLPSPRFLGVDEVHADARGVPRLPQRKVLLSCDLPENAVQKGFPALWDYLSEGIGAGVDQGYLCRHRKPWFSQEKRPASPILCTYMGRGSKEHSKPFRFILNHSKATATNVYLMLYPRPRLAEALRKDPALLRQVWAALNGISHEALVSEGRTYGGGLHKMEPRELGNLSALEVMSVLPRQLRPRTPPQAKLSLG